MLRYRVFLNSLPDSSIDVEALYVEVKSGCLIVWQTVIDDLGERAEPVRGFAEGEWATFKILSGPTAN